MVQAATLAPAAAPSPSRQKGQPAKRGALQRVAPPALDAAAAEKFYKNKGQKAPEALPPDLAHAAAKRARKVAMAERSPGASGGSGGSRGGSAASSRV